MVSIYITRVNFKESIFLCLPKTPHFLTTITNRSISFTQPNQKLYRGQKVTCSADFRDNNNVQYPKPAEIPWKKELCNNVQLIGVIGNQVEIRHLASGKVVAWTGLAVKKSATESFWINLTFWDNLAQVAFQHVEKGNQIYVSGRLIADVVGSEEGKQQAYYKVVVQQFNLIERSPQSTPLYDRDSNNFSTGKKYSNDVLHRATPEELWQAFFVNPTEWWDNRKNKRNPRAPDFKHKDTGEALWIEGRYNPSWVKSQLAILDERMGSLKIENSRMQLTSITDDDLMGF